MIKALIFDNDGTLVDSELIANIALQQELLKYDIELSAVSLLNRFRGGKFAEVLVVLANEHQVTFSDDFAVQFRARVAELLSEQLQAFAGVHQSLKAINLPKSVASNSPANQLHLSLEVTNLKDFFGEHIYSAYQVEMWKPDPGLFLHAAAQMGYPAEQCLVIEDSPVGISAAKAANMKTVLFDPHELHSELSVDYRIRCMSELPDLVNSIDKN